MKELGGWNALVVLNQFSCPLQSHFLNVEAKHHSVFPSKFCQRQSIVTITNRCIDAKIPWAYYSFEFLVNDSDQSRGLSCIHVSYRWNLERHACGEMGLFFVSKSTNCLAKKGMVVDPREPKPLKT